LEKTRTIITENALIVVDADTWQTGTPFSPISKTRTAMSVLDKFGCSLSIYDLVAIERIPDSCYWSADFESDETIRLAHNKELNSCIGAYGMVYFWHNDTGDERWYYESVNEISVMVRQVHKTATSYWIRDCPVALPPNCVQRLKPNPTMMFPYVQLRLPSGPWPLFRQSLSSNVVPQTVDICRRILQMPLPLLAALSEAESRALFKEPI
jgi:hypothetical protein